MILLSTGYRLRPQRICLFVFIGLLVLSGCASPVPQKGTSDYDIALSLFYVGLAAVEVGNDQRAAADLQKASGLAPGEPAVWNNLGVLQLRQKDFEKAADSLGKAKGLAPESSPIHFNLALLALQNNDSESLTAYLNKARELDPKDLRPLYLLAVESEKQQKVGEALAAFEDILKAQPDNLAALIEAARLKAKNGDEQGLGDLIAKLEKYSASWPEVAKDQLTKLKETPLAQAANEIAFLRNVLLRLPAFRASIDRIKPSDTVIGDLIVRPLVLDAPDFSPADPDTDITFKSEPISDQPAESTALLYLNGKDAPAVAVSSKTASTVGGQSLPFAFGNQDQLTAFDFDYDYLNDIAYAGISGFKLFRQHPDGTFKDVTAESGVSLAGEMTGVWSFDFDNEGDLDLLVSSVNGSFVLRNRGNGTFETLKPFTVAGEIVDFEYADLDEDGDSDAFIFQEGGDLIYFENERGGLFKKATEPLAKGISAMAAADTDGDGVLDLNILNNNGELIRYRGPKSAENHKGIRIAETGFADCGNLCSMFVSDLDNNGANDLAVHSGLSTELFLGSKDGEFKKSMNQIPGRIHGYADFDGDGLLDLFGIDKDGRPTRLINKSTKQYGWQIVRPKAAKTEGDQRVNTFGIGGEIESRAGLAVQKQIIRSPQVHFGLGNAKQTDVIRVVWQNGYVQAEFDIKTNQTIAAEQRLKGSCPHLFAWNGTEFAHVKDAPPWSPALGLKINAQDTYGILQTEEWFKIPGEALNPKDGFYELRITGEYWEAYYIDHYRLMAVDHPEDTEIFTDERFAIPLPPLKVFTTEQTNLFKSAVDHNGKDVSGTISELDEKYLDDIKRGRYQGVAEDHYVELELPTEAPLDKKLWIVADGWVHPTDASINVQRGQDVRRPPRSLSIEVQDKNGEWKTVKENQGFPAGKMKTVLLDLDGVFQKDAKSRKLRLRTEMEIFWDKLAWAVAREGESNDSKELELDSAELRYRGFSVIEKPDDSSPEVPVYSSILTTGQRWRDLEGYYTRFGDIKPLLAKTDDRFVLANAGDEIVMKFPSLPPVRKGFKRDFVIIGNGWIKDGDMNSVFSKTVLPLPTQASNDYTKPPGSLEDDPVYQKNQQDWIDFHTRYVTPDGFRKALRR